MKIENREITVYPADPVPDGRAGILWVIGGHEDTDMLFASLSHPRPALAVVGGIDWNRELSPWKAEKVFANGEDFGGEADAFLHLLTEKLIPETEDALALTPAFRGIAGYSLGGLFAVWSLYKTALFDRAASVSGSLWFDGFLAFAKEMPLTQKPVRLYLSYGDREPKTRNPRMRTVGVCTEELAAYYGSIGIPTITEVNPGGHFDEPGKRLAKGICAILR